MLAWHQVELHLALLCTIGLHHGFITCLQPFTHPFHRSIPPDECLLEQLILLQCDVALQVRGAFDSDVQRETTGGKFPGNSRFPGNGREKFEPREFPSYGNFPGLGKFPCHGKFPYSRGHNFLTRYPNYNLKKPLES